MDILNKKYSQYFELLVQVFECSQEIQHLRWLQDSLSNIQNVERFITALIIHSLFEIPYRQYS